MNPLVELGQLGQSVWLDSISRAVVLGGELRRLVDEDAVTGVTSNPTIFQKAMAGGSDYDAAMRRLIDAEPGIGPAALFEALAIEDIRAAADVLRPVFDRTDGVDGFVSYELPPAVAGDTAASIAEAQRLWAAIDRPNLMIKVPATAAGIPAVEALTAAGVNVNITLMFSMAHYERVAQAYIDGLERCARPSRVSSVASFFVSRVDTAVDRALETAGTPAALALRGRIAIANAVMVYERFREIFYGAPFAGLRARGCRVQRPLWASTSAKNPAYRDVMYVEALAGPDTVNTMPPETIDAFRDHGRARAALDEDVQGARAALSALGGVGVDLDAITDRLQVEGVASFAKSYDSLLEALAAKQQALRLAGLDRQAIAVGPVQPRVDARLASWRAHGPPARAAAPEPIVDLATFARRVRDEGTRHVVLLGVGAASLAAGVIHDALGAHADGPELVVLDSTHPGAVRAADRRIDVGRTLFVVASPSGENVETLALFKHFWHRCDRASAGRQFVAITHAGSPLERLAAEGHWRRVFHAAPGEAGECTPLGPFGLVPAALAGVDVETLLEHTRRMAELSGAGAAGAEDPALSLGAALAELALAGRDKLTILSGPPATRLPAWIELLVATRTGRQGQGIVPIVDEPVRPLEQYGADRVFVSLARSGQGEAALAPTMDALAGRGHPVIRQSLDGAFDIGQEFVRWQVAADAAAAALGIRPAIHDEEKTSDDLFGTAMPAAGRAPAPPVLSNRPDWMRAFDGWLASAKPGDFVGIQAFLAPAPDAEALLQRLRERLGRPSGLATTLGFGPGFLYSTGALQVDGPAAGRYLQLTDEPQTDLAVPEAGCSFGELTRARADAHAAALVARGRSVLRIGLGRAPLAALEWIVDAL